MLNFLFRVYTKGKMISENLAEVPPKDSYEPIMSACLFVGLKIKNLYDEERLCIKDSFSPKRVHVEGCNYRLYGSVLPLKGDFITLSNKIKQQKAYDLIGYNTLLQEHKLSCNECYFNLKPPIYPIDGQHIKKVLPEYNFKDFICFNLKASHFQSYTSTNLFLILPV